MNGILTIFRKEMEDTFSSMKFLLILALILMIGIVIASVVGMGIRKETEGMAKPALLFLYLFTSTGKLFSFVQFVAFFGPLLGIILGFDAINREKTARTLSKLVAQPIYRDAIINGKFLAGVTTVTVMLTAMVIVITGLGIRILGIVPGIEEVFRLAVYLVVSIAYLSFWLGISILFSTIFKSTATSALAGIALWIFTSFLIGLIAAVIAGAVAPVFETAMGPDPESLVKNEKIAGAISLVSPTSLYGDATAIILDPMRRTTSNVVLMGPLERMSLSQFQSPLPAIQSFLIVMPHVISLVALTILCFGICYIVFMKQEIRTV